MVLGNCTFSACAQMTGLTVLPQEQYHGPRPNGEVIQARDLALKTKSWNWMELIFACNNDVTQQMTLPMVTRLMQLSHKTTHQAHPSCYLRIWAETAAAVFQRSSAPHRYQKWQ